ncbi:MAG: YeeE/YedE family protein [Bacteroidales bacterium]|nr:YeeE/YedE family protein [Bacteroidales bacterium]
MITLLFGFLFGTILLYAKLNKHNTIAGMATLENLAVAKTIAFAIGLGAILVNLEIAMGFASYHVKPFILGGVILGGLVFGTGMAILGYCPGTLAISLGEGSLDAFTGILGGIAGGLVFTFLWPSIQVILGPDLGSISLQSLAGSGLSFYILLILTGSVFMFAAFWLDRIEKIRNYKWLYSGIALALLTAVVFLTVTSNRVVGASPTYPYLAGLLAGMTDHPYFAKVEKAGNWELIFLSGAFLAGLIFSLAKKEFKITFLHSHWIKYKGDSAMKRAAWSFLGGFLLLFGARMAGGCTSGHVISGGMQLAVSSLVFAVFVFAGLLITGKFFYRRR